MLQFILTLPTTLQQTQDENKVKHLGEMGQEITFSFSKFYTIFNSFAFVER